MYRLVLFTALVSCCFSAPLSGPISQRFVNRVDGVPYSSRVALGDSDVAENPGSGYSFFRNQNIATRPSVSQKAEISAQDLSDYLVANAFSEVIPRRRVPAMNNVQEYQNDVQENWGARSTSRQKNYPNEQSQSTPSRPRAQQQRVFSPQQVNFAHQPTWSSQQRSYSQNRPSPPANTARGTPQYSFPSYTPAPPQPIYSNGW